MIDHADWFDRATHYLSSLRTPPGEPKVERDVGLPISPAKISSLSAQYRLPIQYPIAAPSLRGSDPPKYLSGLSRREIA